MSTLYAQVSTIFFVLALAHTFLTSKLYQFSLKCKKGSLLEKIFYFLSEVEIVFGLWSFFFLIYLFFSLDHKAPIHYLTTVNYTEAVFIVVIMAMASTKPILQFVRNFLEIVASLLPLQKDLSFYLSALIIGPLLGSLITEPAAMTVLALLLKDKFFDTQASQKFKYATIGLLFVNISVGGTITNFAAPPVLVVAKVWGWTPLFMLKEFAWKTILIVILSTISCAFYFRNELANLCSSKEKIHPNKHTPIWLTGSHFLFLILAIIFHTSIPIFLGLFFLFMAWHKGTKEYQAPLRVKQSLLVGFFLAGLFTLGNLQGWWLKPLLVGFSPLQLFLGSSVLTAFTDNAAITYLATLVPGLSDLAKYAIVAGAVTGGGLTIIANAPNPSGYAILKDSFGKDGLSPLKLFLGALPFTLIASLIYLIPILFS